jgi:hypothetical protein
VRSGVVNTGGPFDLRAAGTAADSTYAGIVRLVSEAENSQAPFVRLADRYAMWFLPLTLAVAAVAWALGGAVQAVAVLVVATPCPLILAAPVALVSGLSAAARRGVVVKRGGALAPRQVHHSHPRQDGHAHRRAAGGHRCHPCLPRHPGRGRGAHSGGIARSGVRARSRGRDRPGSS